MLRHSEVAVVGERGEGGADLLFGLLAVTAVFILFSRLDKILALVDRFLETACR